jgi:DNA-binding LytR/AlgR family response regulator
VIIHYLDGDKQLKYIVRNSLKRIETEVLSKSLVRCHRSFIVNIDQVRTIRKEKEGLIISFESPVQVTVPISRTYLESFIKILSHNLGPDES